MLDSTHTILNIHATAGVLRDTVVSVSNKPIDHIWITTIKEILIAYAWPITFLVILFIFREPLGLMLKFAGEFLRDLQEIALEKYGVKMRRGTSSVGTPTLPPDAKSVTELIPEKILADDLINKILATLWRFQNEHSKDFSKRWTFTIGAFNPEYYRFISAMRSLGALGLVAQDRNSQQFFLTDFGIVFCKQNEGKLKSETFTF